MITASRLTSCSGSGTRTHSHAGRCRIWWSLRWSTPGCHADQSMMHSFVRTFLHISCSRRNILLTHALMYVVCTYVHVHVYVYVIYIHIHTHCKYVYICIAIYMPKCWIPLPCNTKITWHYSYTLMWASYWPWRNLPWLGNSEVMSLFILRYLWNVAIFPNDFFHKHTITRNLWRFFPWCQMLDTPVVMPPGFFALLGAPTARGGEILAGNPSWNRTDPFQSMFCCI